MPTTPTPRPTASAKQTTPTPAAEKPGPPTQPRTRCCDLPRHRSAPPSPATGITGRGHMPHRPPVQRSLPRADTRPGPSPNPRSPPRSPFHHRAETSSLLGHPGPTPEGVSPAIARRPLTPARPPQRVSQTRSHPRFLTPENGPKQTPLPDPQKRGKIRPKKPLQKFVTPHRHFLALFPLTSTPLQERGFADCKNL